MILILPELLPFFNACVSIEMNEVETSIAKPPHFFICDYFKMLQVSRIKMKKTNHPSLGENFTSISYVGHYFLTSIFGATTGYIYNGLSRN